MATTSYWVQVSDSAKPFLQAEGIGEMLLGRVELTKRNCQLPQEPVGRPADREVQSIGRMMHRVGCPIETVIEPLTGEEKDDDDQRELDPYAGEIGAGEAAFGARSGPLLVFHSAMKLSACEDFHKRKHGWFRTEAENFSPLQLHERSEVSV